MIALYVFWIRQVKKYFRSPARILGSLGQPLLYLVALGLGLGTAVGDVSGDVAYLDFLVPGVVGLTVLFSGMFAGIELISDRRFGFLRETLVAPVKRFWIFIGMASGGATIATFQGFLVLMLSLIFGFRPESWMKVPLAIVIMFLIAMIFTMVGLIIATKSRDFQSFPLIINFIVFPLFFLSGAIFPLQGIPKALDIVTKINPLTYGIDLLRSLLIGGGFYDASTTLMILVGLLVVFGFFGARLFKRMTI